GRLRPVAGVDPTHPQARGKSPDLESAHICGSCHTSLPHPIPPSQHPGGTLAGCETFVTPTAEGLATIRRRFETAQPARDSLAATTGPVRVRVG
ncbi:MAG: hypothetical protein OXF27_06995, partial [Acidobacteria bacterium]|nr:hypothetical protein [Acidobacteriota bacterium]